MLQKNNIGELANPTHERVQSQYSPSDNQIQTTKNSPVLLWMSPSGSYLAIINNVSWGVESVENVVGEVGPGGLSCWLSLSGQMRVTLPQRQIALAPSL